MKKTSLDILNEIAKNSLYAKVANSETVKYSFQVFKNYISSGPILELGPAEGVMTELINAVTADLTIVDGSLLFCEKLKEKYPQANIINSLFEDFCIEKKFQTIILGHVLEHVDDPVAMLKHISQFLLEDGVILAAVPNANSIHRQAAVLMGILSTIKEFSELDIHHGHQRVYTIEEFESDFMMAGLNVKKLGGYWLKPISNAQIENSWTPEMLSAFMILGEKYPEIAAEIYIVAEKK